MPDYDINRDGQITRTDIDDATSLLELELSEEKANTQKCMAWVSLSSMVIFTIVLFMPFVTDNRLKSIADLVGLFYLAQAGVVGAYMGATAYSSRNNSINTSTSRFSSFSRPKPTSMSNDVVKGRD